MDIREVVTWSETYALIAGVIVCTLGYHRLMDPLETKIWAACLFSYAANRFVSKTAKASFAPKPNGGSK